MTENSISFRYQSKVIILLMTSRIIIKFTPGVI